MDPVSTAFGVILWTLFTAAPILFLLLTVYRFSTRRPCILQPVQGTRAVTGQSTSLLFSLLFHLVVLGGVAVAVVLRPMTTQTIPPGHSSQYYGADTPAEAVVLFGSIVVDAVYLCLWGLLGVYQLFFIFASLAKWHFVLKYWYSSPNIVTPKLWAGQCLFLILHWSIVLLLGIDACAIGGCTPQLAFYIFLISAMLQIAPLFLLKWHMEALPGPGPGGAPGYPQLVPPDGSVSPAAAWGHAPVVGQPIYNVDATRVREPEMEPDAILPPKQLAASEYISPPSNYGYSVPVVVHASFGSQVELQQHNAQLALPNQYRSYE